MAASYSYSVILEPQEGGALLCSSRRYLKS